MKTLVVFIIKLFSAIGIVAGVFLTTCTPLKLEGIAFILSFWFAFSNAKVED